MPFTSREILHVGTDCSIYKASGDIGLPKYSVLKSYCAQHDGLYENEVQIYRDLGQHKDISNNIARFYGSWKQGDTRNILLEYVEGSTLTNFFKHEHPTSEGDMVEFWSNLIQILGPVCRLHDHHDQENHNEAASGVHQNIKSDSILVSRNHGESRFAYNFKLADLGLAYNPLVNKPALVMRGHDRPCAQAYSAPECFRDEPNRFDRRDVRVAKPSQDIWSLGCLFSEALVWSVFGSTGLDEYRQRRKAATDSVPNIKNTLYSGCFHDGAKLSTVVRETHDRARRSLTVLHELVLIIEDMLNEDTKERPGAGSARKEFRKALNAAQRILVPRIPERHMHPSPRQKFDASVPGGTDVQPRRAPPLAPKPTRIRPALGPIGQFGTNSKEKRHHCGPSGNQSTHAYQAHSPHQSAAVSQRMVTYYESSVTRNTLTNAVEPATGLQSVIKAPNSGDKTAAHVSEHTYHTLDGQPNPPFPHATVREVLDWIDQRKKKSTSVANTPPVLDMYLDTLRGADQIFVIDNSISMLQHKLDARKTLEALSYIVKRFDPDGLDMYFTMSKQSDYVHGTHREKLLTRFDNADFDGQSTVDYTLSRILENNNKKGWKLFRFRRESAKGKSIYVLTDGKWLGNSNSLCGVPELLERVVRHINRRADLGIQFIQFGDDEVGTWRLEELDNRLEKRGVAMDIVDTERHDGNVYKMLLGHLSSNWDDSPTSPITRTHPVLNVQFVNG
ncbi:Nn.00g059390.m01.CDS01 [Neocucurbitaria sp. VM-36]